MAQDRIDSNADADPHRNPRADPNSNPHAYTNANSQTDSNTYCDTNPNTSTVTDGDVLSRDQPERFCHNYRRPQLGGQYIDDSQFQHERHGL